MNLFFRFLISYSLVQTQFSPALVYASPGNFVASDTNVFNHETVKEAAQTGNLTKLQVGDEIYLEDKISGKKSVSKYALGGVESIESFKKNLRTEPLTLKYNPDALVNNSQYKELLKDEVGRNELFRQYKQTFSSLSHSLKENIFANRKALRAQIRAQVIEEMMADGKSRAEITGNRDMRQKVSLEIHRKFLDSFTPEQRRKALSIIREAQQFLMNAQARANYNFRHGIAPGKVPSAASLFKVKNLERIFKGEGVVRVLDPFNKYVDIGMPADGKGMTKVEPVKLLERLKTGAFETSKFGMAFLMIMYLSAQAEMLISYRNNPMAGKKFVEMFSEPAFHLSMASFFIGGGLVGSVAALPEVVTRKSIFNLYNAKNIKFSDVRSLQRYIQTNMVGLQSGFMGKLMQRATSYSGLGGGLLLSQIVYQAVYKLSSCRRMLRSEPGEFNTFERQRMKQACDKGYKEIVSEILKNPQIWMQIMSIWSAKALLTFGMTKTQLLNYGRFNGSKHVAVKQAIQKLPAQSFKYSVKIAARGVMAPIVSFAVASVPTLIALGVFVAIFEAVFWILETGYEKLTVNYPTYKVNNEMRELMKSYREIGWDMKSLCESIHLNKEVNKYSSIRYGTEKTTVSKFKEQKTCVEKLTDGFIKKYQSTNKAWRKKMYEPIDMAINNWIEYTFQATNMYKASHLLYRDISEQIRLQKLSEIEFEGGVVEGLVHNSKISFKISESPISKLKESAGFLNFSSYNNPLPLFRSEPFFGWYFKNETDEDYIPYPRVDGTGVVWEERLNDTEKTDLLNQRFERFKSTVLPKFIESFEKGLKENPFEAPVYEKAKEALKLLKTDKDQYMVYGLELISQLTAEELSSNPACGMNLFAPTKNGRKKCFFSGLQIDFLDKNYWVPSVQDEMRFKKSRYPYFAGYQTSSSIPFGVKPLSHGQRFFIDYHKRLQVNGVDPFYFSSSYESMTDYLLKNMLCGVDVQNGEHMLKNKRSYRKEYKWDFLNIRQGIARAFSWRSPKYEAPKIPLKSDFNPCFGTLRTDQHGEQNNRAWIGDFGFYNYIEDSKNPDRNYSGIVHLLYEEAHDDFVNNFDQWWDEYVKPEFEIVVNKVYEDYFLGHQINKKLHEAMIEDNGEFNCRADQSVCTEFDHENKDGIIASMRQEIEVYFTYFLQPLIEDLDMDIRYVTSESSQVTPDMISVFKKDQLSDFHQIRKDIFAIFGSLATDGTTPSNDNFLKEYNELYQETKNRVAAESDGESVNEERIHDFLKIRTLNVLLEKKLYELGVLFKSTTEDTIAAYFDLLEKLVKENKNASEADVAAAETELEETKQEWLNAYENDMERQGKVLVNYKDWDWPNEGDDSPTLLTVRYVLGAIKENFDELLNVKMLKYKMSNVDDM